MIQMLPLFWPLFKYVYSGHDTNVAFILAIIQICLYSGHYSTVVFVMTLIQMLYLLWVWFKCCHGYNCDSYF